ncbi:MAG: hypothetical protein KAX80_11645 [Planctomycetes bacterium]|nr:hypothetical protein [Planctomycetota bacterium]
MDEILVKVDVVIEELDSKAVLLILKGDAGSLTSLLDALIEGRMYLRRARAALRQSQSLLQKGYGKLVGPKVP